MSIRTFNFLLLMFTLFGGMALAGIYAWTAADRDRAIVGLSTLQLGEERLKALTNRIDVVLTAADLAVGSGETYSANWARDQAYVLASDMEAMAQEGDVLALHIETGLLVTALHALGNSIESGQMQSSETLDRFDAASIEVIEALIRGQSSLRAAVNQQGNVIEEVTAGVWRAQVISAVCFIVLSIMLSVFGIRLIVRPLERVQQASDTEDANLLADEAFRQAPTEIRELAAALRSYLGHLTNTVAQRTQELETQRDELREEVILRTKAEADMATALRVAEEASAAKSDFLSITSHELRTPLNTMTAALALLRPEELTAEQVHYCDLAAQAGDNLGVLLRDILDFSALDAGKFEIISAPLNLPSFAATMLEHSVLVAEGKGVTLASYVAPNLPETILLDQNRARQVVDNLITNALKFSQGKPVHLSFTQRPGGSGEAQLVIAVSDEGPGISQADQSKIFEPFTQLDASLGRSSSGVGLGLALCKDLARAMGGDCTVASRPGEGATFELRLPIREVKANVQKDAVGLEENDGRCALHVLLVEDSEVNRMLTQKLLENQGHTVALAVDGFQACEQCAREVFEVILMDLQMPGIDGLEATRRIKATEGPNQNTPVIALTANVGGEFHKAVEAVGMVGFVEKPIDPRQMTAEITRVFKSFAA